MRKRTKIVATLGPATTDEGVLEEMFRAGVDVVRLNFSHGSADDHRAHVARVREIAGRVGQTVAVLGDLQGPKLRIARFRDGGTRLGVGDRFVLDADLDPDEGDGTRVGLDYPDLPSDCEVGDTLLLDDGRVRLRVTAVDGPRVETEVVLGGRLSNHKGLNKLGGGLSAAALTEKDRRDIVTAAELGVDYVAVSFPRCAHDLHLARRLLEEAGSDAEIVAKIERAEAVASAETLDAMILACEGVMVARGDLGVEIGDAELIGVQKHIIRRARELNRIVIVATQMMESMIVNPTPTRAEVFDVANAILDGTDAVMLSAETAVGAHPVEVVEAMTRICRGAEKHLLDEPPVTDAPRPCERIDEAIARSAMYTANRLIGACAIICLTHSGSTARWMSRIRSGLPILALTRHGRSMRRMALYRGVRPMLFEGKSADESELEEMILAEVRAAGALASGDLVILTRGVRRNEAGGTDSMRVVRVP